jgi:hypothetical protein
MVFALERPVPRGVQGVHGDEGEESPEAKKYKENFLKRRTREGRRAKEDAFLSEPP